MDRGHHIVFNMATIHFVLVLLIQSTLIYADIDKDEYENITEIYPTEVNSQETKDDGDNTFIVPDTELFPSSTASMEQVINSDKTPEEQLEEIKEMATSITDAIQSEMENLLNYALSITDNNTEDNRKKRSIDTPMDSTKLVWRLLKHIKSNNEYQNIAIEKMMSAQEIADKYGIEFTPDTEILSELAVAANEQAKELTSILKDACDLKNCTQNLFTNNTECDQNNQNENYTCPIHSFKLSENDTESNMTAFNIEDMLTNVEYNHIHYEPYSYSSLYNSPYETQIPAPPVSQKQTFYDAVSYNPMEYYGPYCSLEPSNVYFDDYFEPEPEIVGEEFEETISSKIYVDHEVEPGAATVNHVMTYTIAEKTHYRTPQIENLPQQMQYYFLLV